MPHPIKETLERELKLGVEQNFRLPTWNGARLEPRTFTSTYYDTSDYRLAKSGITLRRRVQGKHGAWQLKLPSKSARRELEFADSTSVPQDIRGLLFAHLRNREVIPIAKLRTRRRGIRVTEGGNPLAEVVVDSVAVLDGTKIVRRFAELEVELIQGDEDLLRRLETTLRKAGARDGDPRPKVFKALALDLSSPGDSISRSASAIDHLKHKLDEQLHGLLAHDPGVRLGASTEDVHQMRVATRRLRSFLRSARSIFLPEWVDGLRAELKWVGSVLGSVRDLDVQVERLRSEFSILSLPERRALAHILKLLESDRSKARSQMLDAMNAPRYLKLLDELEAASQNPRVVDPAGSLQKIATKEFKKLTRDVRALPPHPTDGALHGVRIKVKRARYAAELAEGMVGKAAGMFIRRSKIMQDLLGDHQDGVMMESRLRRLLSQVQTPMAALTLGRLIERRCAARRAVREIWKDEWKNLKACGRKVWA